MFGFTKISSKRNRTTRTTVARVRVCVQVYNIRTFIINYSRRLQHVYALTTADDQSPCKFPKGIGVTVVAVHTETRVAVRLIIRSSTVVSARRISRRTGVRRKSNGLYILVLHCLHWSLGRPSDSRDKHAGPVL